MAIPLFVNSPIREKFDRRERKALDEVEEIQEEELGESKANELYKKHRIAPIKLGETKREKGEETKRGRELLIRLQYNGDKELLKYKPSSWTSKNPRCKSLNDSEIVLSIEIHDSKKSEEVETEISNRIQLIKKWVEYLNSDIESFNESLSSKIEEKIFERKEKLQEADKKIEGDLLD